MTRINLLLFSNTYFLSELYNFDRAVLAARLGTAPRGSEFYGFNPVPGWRVLILDPYQESMIG